MSEEVVRKPDENTFLTEFDRDEQCVLVLLIDYMSDKAGVTGSDESLIRRYGPGLLILILKEWLGS